MARGVNVVTQAKIEGQVFANLVVVLDVSRIVVWGPAREDRGHLKGFLVRSAKEEAGEGITWLAVVRCEGRLKGEEWIGRRLVSLALSGKLVRAPIKAEAEGVTALDPRDAFGHD